MGKFSLDRILQLQGFGTRKRCGEMIAAGEVSISGETVTDARSPVDADGLEFTIFGESWLLRKTFTPSRAWAPFCLRKTRTRACSREGSTGASH